MTKVHYAMLLLMLVFFACTDGKREQAETLHQQVMAIHDKTMALMGYMHELEITVLELSAEENDPNRRRNLEQAGSDLKLAQKEMMVWMRQYKQPPEAMAYSDQITYLQDQMQKIIRVEELADKAVSMAESLINRP